MGPVSRRSSGLGARRRAGPRGRGRLWRGLVVLGCALWLSATPISAWAEPGDASGSPDVGSSEYALTMEELTDWQYNTYYLFPLTRHIEETGLPRWAQLTLMPATAAIDLFQLPGGLIGGLFGD